MTIMLAIKQCFNSVIQIQIQIQIETYKAPVTMKSATGAVQMQIKMKIML